MLLKMGCTRSRIEPLICQSDEKKFLANWSHCKADNRVFTSQSSSDFSLVKVGGEGNQNGDTNPCPSWYSKVPELVILLLLFLFALTIYRKWEAKKRAKAIRRALGFGTLANHGMAFQAVSFQSGDLPWRGMGARYLD